MSKRLLFYLVEEDGRVRQVVNGVVTSLNKKTPLKNAPIGWEDILIIWERSMERFGPMQNFTLPLGFVLEGAKIVRNDSYKFNVDRKLFLLIQKFVSEITPMPGGKYKEYYKFLYKGELDFSTFNDKPIEGRVDLNIMQGGNAKLLKAGEATQFNIPFDDDSINIENTGIELFQKATFVFAGSVSNATIPNKHTSPIIFISREGVATLMAFFSQTVEGVNLLTPTYVDDSTNYFAINGSATTPVSLHIYGTIPFRCTKNDIGANYDWKLVKNNGTEILIYDSAGDLVVGQTYSPVIDLTIVLQPGERLFKINHFYGPFSGSAQEVAVDFLETGRLYVDFSSVHPTTYTKAFRLYDLYKKICYRCGIAMVDSVSTLLQASTIALTCGDALRQIDNAALKTNFNDFFKACNVYHMVGQGVEHKKIVIEGREHFFDETNISNLGDVVLKEIVLAADLMFSSIKIGHQEQDVDELNGKYDFNGFHIYSSPIKSAGQKQLDLQSPYKAGPFEIEKERINLDGQLTTDHAGDNNIFAMDVKPQTETTIETSLQFTAFGNFINAALGVKYLKGQRFKLVGSLYNDYTFTILGVANILVAQLIFVDVPVTDEAATVVQLTFLTGQVYSLNRDIVVESGVPSVSTIFNVALRPSELLKKHYRWIKSVLFNYNVGKLTFESANRSKDLKVGGLLDGRDVPVGIMGEPMFQPYYFILECKTNESLVDDLDIQPNTAFEFTSKQDTYRGFAIRVSIAANDLKPQEYKLLSSPNNNLKTLIL